MTSKERSKSSEINTKNKFKTAEWPPTSEPSFSESKRRTPYKRETTSFLKDGKRLKKM